jgi:YegS/Rv2252/BmrU family lipid kinase
MSAVAVVAHSRKSLDGGLGELRKALAERGVENPLWLEVDKSRQAPAQVERALSEGAELIFVWGGDGMVQRSVDAIAGSKASLAIVPAGTANLFASNLGIPRSISGAVEIGLNGRRGVVDVGRMNGERFAVMAGLGLDARVIRDATPELKSKFGRMAYVWAATKNMSMDTFTARIDVDGEEWYRGVASCILFGNVGRAFAGIELFDDAHTDDGLLEVGVASADGIAQWGRTFARSAFGNIGKSPFVHMTKARRVDVKLDRKVLYELDGGDRAKRKKFRVEAEPTAISVCLPAEAA